MSEFKDRKPPVLDDIIEPGLVEKARPALDDAQPSLWGDQEFSADASRSATGADQTEPDADHLCDTMEIEVATDVSTLEDDFDIDPVVPAGVHEERQPDSGEYSPYASVVVQADFTPDTGEGDHARGGDAFTAPAPAASPAARLDDPVQPVEAVEAVEAPFDATESLYTTLPDTTEREPDADVAAAQMHDTTERAALPAEHAFDGAAADTVAFEALTNRLVRTLMPELELILRKRIREILEKSLSDHPSAHDTD